MPLTRLFSGSAARAKGEFQPQLLRHPHLPEEETGREYLFGSAANNPERKSRLQREIEATGCQIDQLVYELYGQTEEEIEIVGDETTTK